MRIWIKFLAQFPVSQLWFALQLDVGLNETHQEEAHTLKCHGRHMVCQKQVLPVFGLRFERGPGEPQKRRPSTVFAVADTDAPRRRAKVTPFIQSERQHAVITAGRASPQSSSSSSSSSWGTSSCSLMLRSQPGDILGWKWTSTVEGLVFLFFSIVFWRCVSRNKRLFASYNWTWTSTPPTSSSPSSHRKCTRHLFHPVCSSTLLRLFGCQSRVRRAGKVLPATERCRNILSHP